MHGVHTMFRGLMCNLEKTSLRHGEQEIYRFKAVFTYSENPAMFRGLVSNMEKPYSLPLFWNISCVVTVPVECRQCGALLTVYILC